MPIPSPTPASSLLRKAVPRNRLGFALGATLFAAAIWAVPAAASPATYDGISAGGSVAVFSTEESLVPSDTDRERDVYERSYDESLGRYVTREVSIGPTGGNDAQPARFDAVSADGNEVFFSTKEPLVAEDHDHSTDIYMRDLGANTTTLVSRGASNCEAEGCSNGNFDATFAAGGLTIDGEKLFFVTDEKLSKADKDSVPDIYMRDHLGNPQESTTTLVSRGASDCEAEGCGDGSFGVTFNAVSADGTAVVFSSNESLAKADEDELQDVYERDLSTGTTRLVSTPRAGGCPGGLDCKAVYGGVSADGSHVFFESSERISTEDSDESQDVYDWSRSGGVTLASIGSNPGDSNGPFNATFAGSSADGGAIYFETSEPLVEADTDAKQDVYKRAGGVTTLVSTGLESRNGPANASLKWVSPEGSDPAVIFSTTEALTSDDTDTTADLYERAAGETTLVSTGPQSRNGPADATFAGASHDGSHVFFTTPEALVAEDQDSSVDLYERAAGETTLVSTGPESRNSPADATFAGASDDGSRVFFTTEERLTEGDPDAEADLYERSAGVTRLVSTGNLLTLGPATPTLTATDPASPGASLTPSILGNAAPGTWIELYTSFDCSGIPVVQGTEEELAGEGLTVTVIEGSTTSFRATAEAGGLVSPCSGPISYRQENPPPPPPPSEGGSGSGGGSGGGASGSGTTQPGSSGGTGAGAHGGGSTFLTPQTAITFGPASKTRKRKIVFRFADLTGQPGTKFFCKVDRHGWGECSSPKRVARLKPGRHLFEVKAVNAVGTWDSAPSARSFKVVR